MKKLLSFLFMLTVTLVCFDKGDVFCVNPEHVTAILKGNKGTMIILRNTELITNEKFETVVKKIRDAE